MTRTISTSRSRRIVMFRPFLASAAVLLLCSAGLTDGAAQDLGGGRFPVRVALVDQLPDDVPATDVAVVVLRNGSGPDAIYLKAGSASGAALTAAVFKLMLVRQKATASAEGALLRVPEAAYPLAWADERLRADRFLERLESVTPIPLRGFGTARVRMLFLPRNAVVAQLRGAKP
jgi:hypothetical protein